MKWGVCPLCGGQREVAVLIRFQELKERNVAFSRRQELLSGDVWFGTEEIDLLIVPNLMKWILNKRTSDGSAWICEGSSSSGGTHPDTENLPSSALQWNVSFLLI